MAVAWVLFGFGNVIIQPNSSVHVLVLARIPLGMNRKMMRRCSILSHTQILKVPDLDVMKHSLILILDKAQHCAFLSITLTEFSKETS